MAGFLIPPWFVDLQPQPVSVYILTWLWGFEIACGIFTFAKAFRQTYMMHVRSRRWNMYIWLVWAEWIACIVISIISWLYLHGTIPPSFWIFFFILFFWTIQVQCILQIIINRVALLMYDQRSARRMRIGVFLIIALINISVFIVWLPARLQVSEEWVHANAIWDRIEKCIFLVVDASLNFYFIYCVRTKLIANGLEKYKVLFWFNCSMVFVSISLDILIIGIMSMRDDLIYMQFHPLTYLIKLHIELNMADLIAKVVRASNPLPSVRSDFQEGLGMAPPATPPVGGFPGAEDAGHFWSNQGIMRHSLHSNSHSSSQHRHSNSSNQRRSRRCKIKRGLQGMMEMFSGTEARSDDRPPTGYGAWPIFASNRRPASGSFQLQQPPQSIGRIASHCQCQDLEAGPSTSTSQGSAELRKLESQQQAVQQQRRHSDSTLESMRDYASIRED